MNPVARKLLYPFLLPSGLLSAVIIFGLRQQSLPAQLIPLFEVLPFAVVLIALLLGWRFNRMRLIYAIALLVLVERLLTYSGTGSNSHSIAQLVQLLLPINLLLVCLLRERGMLNRGSLFWLLFLVAELAGAAWLWRTWPESLARWLNCQLLELPLSGLPFTQLQLLVSGLVLLLFFWRYLLKSAAFEASFFWAQLLVLVGFGTVGGQPLRIYLAAAGLVLILGIMESSHALAYRDELTGLPGRRALNEMLAKLGRRYVVAMLDIDHFKKFNDTHGHDVGDQVLRMVASKLAAVAGGGKVFRYGGEEFTVVFPRKSVQFAMPYLEQLRQAVEAARFIPRSKDRPKKKPKKKPAGRNCAATLKVTISIGVAERSNALNSSAAVMDAADQALYRAKKAGRNQVCS